MIDTQAGSILRRERRRRDLAIIALATLAGCSPTTIVAVEKYGYRPSASVRARIAAALGLAAETIWTTEAKHS